MTKITEADVAKVVIEDLQAGGWECYPEVKLAELTGRMDWGNGIADVVAVKGPLAMIVECKLTYSLQLLEQALEWTRIAPLVAVVARSVEGNKQGLRRHLADYHGIGSAVARVDIGYPGQGDLHWYTRPRLLRHNRRNVDTIRSVLTPAMQTATAGSRETKRHTKFQETMTHARVMLLAYGPLPMGDLVERLAEKEGHHYASDRGARQGIATAIHHGWVPDLKLDGGLVHFDQDACEQDLRWLHWRAAWERAGKTPGRDWRTASLAQMRRILGEIPCDRRRPTGPQMEML